MMPANWWDFGIGVAIGLGGWGVFFEATYRIRRWHQRRRHRRSARFEPEFVATSSSEGVAWWKGGLYVLYRRMVGGEELLITQSKDFLHCFFFEPTSTLGEHKQCVMFLREKDQHLLHTPYGWYCGESIPPTTKQLIDESRALLAQSENARG